jgi:hypothetical protein
MTVDSWWADKLGLNAPHPQAPLYVPQPPPQYQQAPLPQGGPQQPAGGQYGAPKPESLSQFLAMQQQGLISPDVGHAAKADPYPCPNCGSNNYFSRKGSGAYGAAPAPHCFGCGYNGRFTQDPMAPQARQ